MATAPRPNSGAQLTTTQAKFKTFRDVLVKQQEEFGKALPKDVGALDGARFVRTALTLFRINPQLLDCTTESVVVAMLQAAAFGLELDPVLGQAYLVPYGKTCQLIIGYRGYMNLARRSNQVTSIQAKLVHQKDQFDWEEGLDRRVFHKPYMGDEEPGPVIAAYCIARFSNGDFHPWVMTRRELLAIKNRSRAKGGPWSTDEGAMMQKTVIRHAAKFWPIYIEDIMRAAELDDQVDTGRDQTLVSIQPGIDLLPAPDATDPPAEEQPQKTALDRLTEAAGGDDQPEQGQDQGQAEPSPQTAQEGPQKADPPKTTEKPAATRRAKPEAAAKGGAPPETVSSRQESRTEQATRHEVPRAHQQAREPEQAGLMSEEEARELDRELADQDATDKAPGREPGDDDE